MAFLIAAVFYNDTFKSEFIFVGNAALGVPLGV